MSACMFAQLASGATPALTDEEVVARVQLGEFAAPGDSPEQRAIQEELRGVLESSIASLPQSYRAVISFRLIGEMPTADTAAYLGISEQGVKTRLLRARRLLQRKL